MAKPSSHHGNLPKSGYVSANSLALAFETTPSTIWRWSKSGRLPKPVKLAEGTTRWNLEEIHRILSELAA